MSNKLNDHCPWCHKGFEGSQKICVRKTVDGELVVWHDRCRQRQEQAW